MIDRISQHTFLTRLTERSLVIDLGANRGEFALGILDRYPCRVVAVEPVPEIAAALPTHDRLQTIEAAATATDGTATLTYDSTAELSGSLLGQGIVGSSLGENVVTASVRTISLRSILEMIGGKGAELLKMDIEGAELDVLLHSSPEVLRSFAQITVEFHDFWYPELAERTEEAKRRMQSLGFWTVRFTPNNKDVLFVNQSVVDLSGLMKMWIGIVLRNWNGLGRALRLLTRKLTG